MFMICVIAIFLPLRLDHSADFSTQGPTCRFPVPSQQA